MSIIGKHCPSLAYLSISLGPESFSEQQLSDEGFADLIESQRVRSSSLREVDISNCFTSAVTAKTILNFSKLESVSRLQQSDELNILNILCFEDLRASLSAVLVPQC